MYLSEMFLDAIHRDYSPDSIKRAVKICNDEIVMRENEIALAELLDFWDVYKEFGAILDLQEMREFELIRMGIEQGGE